MCSSDLVHQGELPLAASAADAAGEIDRVARAEAAIAERANGFHHPGAIPARDHRVAALELTEAVPVAAHLVSTGLRATASIRTSRSAPVG